MELKGVVHSTFEQTPKFADVVTVPFDDTFWVVVSAAQVVSVSAIAITTKAITAVDIESFIFDVFFSSYKPNCVLSLNKAC